MRLIGFDLPTGTPALLLVPVDRSPSPLRLLQDGVLASARWETLPDDLDAGDVVALVRQRSEAQVLVMMLNPSGIIDEGLPDRVDRALSRISPWGPWCVAAAGGVDAEGHPFTAVYASAQPSVNPTREPVPIADAAADLVVVNCEALRTLSAAVPYLRLPLAAWLHWLVVQGYLDGRISLFVPDLCLGVHGHRLVRDQAAHSEAVGRDLARVLADERIPSLVGTLPVEVASPEPGVVVTQGRRADLPRLRDAMDAVVARCCRPLSLSIVTRTRFARPHLLRRMLTSISRHRLENLDLEVVLSTDQPAADAQAEVDALRRDFLHVPIRLQVNEGAHGHSRVDNLLGGLLAAAKEYVVVMDDDDYLADGAFDRLQSMLALGQQPVIAVSTELRRERWVTATDGRAVLASSTHDGRYPGSGWRDMFRGVNRLPSCGLVLPRTWLTGRMGSVGFRHDLSEDYALWLLVLSAPDLPPIRETEADFCVVSLRDDGTNTVTMTDRGPWVRDITLFLYDLLVRAPQAGEGLLQVLSASHHPSAPALHASHVPREARLRREINLLARENAHLQSLLEGASR